MIFPWLTLFDCRNVFSRFFKAFDVGSATCQDYTIVVPFFNSPDYLSNLSYLKDYKEKTILCTLRPENEEMARFVADLRKRGYRVIEFEREGKGDRKYGLLKKVTQSQVYDILRKRTMPFVTTKYVVFLDGDSRPQGDLGSVCAVMEKEGLDVVSVKVVPDASSNLVERMQRVEYNISMLARHYFPWLTSGACTVGRTETMSAIMRRHSLYFWGGDIEVGVIARRMGKRIGHVNFKVYTKVPRTLFGLFKQRVGWFCGGFRMSTVNFDKHLKSPLYLIYSCGLVYLLLPLKWMAILIRPWVLPLLILLYVPITFLSNWQVRSRDMIIFPLYAAFQMLIMPAVGFFKYVQVLVKERIHGRLK
jgi:cellulose synthase/poly-beta-1,6-N-acetylglucosamine synthase-like glycosyltransferase